MSGLSSGALLSLLTEAMGLDSATFTAGAFNIGVNASLAAAGQYEIAVTTGASELVISGIFINTDSSDATFTIFEDSVFSGGTPLPAFITDRNSGLVPDVEALVFNPTVTDIGIPVSPSFQVVGATGAASAQNIFFPSPLILKPATNYIWQVVNASAGPAQVNSYFTAYRRRIPSDQTRQVPSP